MSVSIIKAPGIHIPTFKYLDEIVSILGGTKMAFYPFLNTTGAAIDPYGSGNDGVRGVTKDESGVITIQSELAPIRLGSLNAYYFNAGANNHIDFSGDAVYSHVGAAFSMGAWILPETTLGTPQTIMSKYESTGNLEEYDFRFDGSGNLVLELHDASVSASETGTGASDVLEPWVWNFVVATYDGTPGGPDIHLYKNASDTNASGATTESGSFAAMEDTAATFKFGARNTTGIPAQEYEGHMALPFIIGKELTQDEVSEIYGIGQKLIGIV